MDSIDGFTSIDDWKYIIQWIFSVGTLHDFAKKSIRTGPAWKPWGFSQGFRTSGVRPVHPCSCPVVRQTSQRSTFWEKTMGKIRDSNHHVVFFCKSPFFAWVLITIFQASIRFNQLFLWSFSVKSTISMAIFS